MNLIRLKYVSKIILINILVFCVPLVLFDVYFLYGKLDYRTQNVTCAAKLTNYDYCASITHLRYMQLADKWLPVSNFIDENNRSTYKKIERFPNNGKRIFLIGDSFIQAEELHIEDRFEHGLRESGFEVFAFGYSSWNSRQFNAIVKTLDLREGDSVLVFTMGNDYTPSYYRSTVKTDLNVLSDSLTIADERSLFRKIFDNSLIVNTVSRAKIVLDESFASSNDSHSSNFISISHNRENWMDCSSLPGLTDVASSDVHNYLSLSKNEKCWSAEIKESVEINIDLLAEATEVAQLKKASLQLVLVPAGWAFPNQNTLGRMSKIYSINEGVVVSQIGLSDKLIKEGFEVIDLEPLLAEYLSEGDNSLYFPADGHFTKKAHRIIGDYFKKIL